MGSKLRMTYDLPLRVLHGGGDGSENQLVQGDRENWQSGFWGLTPSSTRYYSLPLGGGWSLVPGRSTPEILHTCLPGAGGHQAAGGGG